MTESLISICIPAYKKPEYVVRAIQSILKQSYKKVEIIISDDSPNEDIKIAIQPYISDIDIKYYHNQPALKSPMNWNNALDKANGDYVMLLHQDDWLHDVHALEIYLHSFLSHPGVGFVFCKNTAIQPDGVVLNLQAIKSLLGNMVHKPHHILRANVIGPPSNVMLKRSIPIRYDENYIWLVDVDYYVQLLEAGNQYIYLDQHIVSIGLHEDQTTVFCRNNEDVIVKENIHFAHKLGNNAFADILIYDYYWRLLRNYKIRTVDTLHIYGVLPERILPVIRHQLNWEKLFPIWLLKIGPFSKLLMSLNYLTRPSI
jgi:glycosyltransferase involved in cell wall biosynthesis